ncbi:RHS repeat-associated core domain-containing protein [Anaerovirgula multivorans]|uniref:RHS repeat-associated core domain-containing protein n=1 Tax=Anaerovirgula multivorans TaxID=312168 RepID=A0A239KY94_9FIRM|nr:RHS repeat-associated core domain-containing protein [Anaerovirgula multivorans]SNT22722.1 RHS repeat-associated core domain-containing protein [Anaerovirgula multivorans]
MGTYNYDGLDRKIEAVKLHGSYQINVYDVMSYRVGVTEKGISHDFVFSGANIIAEINTNTGGITRYTRGHALVATKDHRGISGYYLHNSHRDTMNLVGENGEIQNQYQYDAFGNITDYAARITNPFRYAGEQYDQMAEQYYLRARYYNPKIGRFTQEDTFRGDGLNLYTYVSNNPIRYVDPSGLAKCSSNNEVDAVTGAAEPLRTPDQKFLDKKDYAVISALKTKYNEYKDQGDSIKADAMHYQAVIIRKDDKYKDTYKYIDNYNYTDYESSSKLYVIADYLNESELWKHGGEPTKQQEGILKTINKIPTGGVGEFFSRLDYLMDKSDPNYKQGKNLKAGDVFVYVGTSVNQPAYGEESFYREGNLLYKYDQPQGPW